MHSLPIHQEGKMLENMLFIRCGIPTARVEITSPIKFLIMLLNTHLIMILVLLQLSWKLIFTAKTLLPAYHTFQTSVNSVNIHNSQLDPDFQAEFSSNPNCYASILYKGMYVYFSNASLLTTTNGCRCLLSGS